MLNQHQNKFLPEEDSKVQARLARNRTTARLRRERKKHEAEVLTKYVAGIQKRINELSSVVDSRPAEESEKLQMIVDQCGTPPVCCQFCAQLFTTDTDKNAHVTHIHEQDVKAREAFLAESRKFGLSVDGMEELENSEEEEEDTYSPLVRMSSEDRRKRRLERNAASARLCRQRKKLYIEGLRSQIPGLRHQKKALEHALGEAIAKELDAKSPLPPSLEELYGDEEQNNPPHPRTLSNFSDSTVDVNGSDSEIGDPSSLFRKRKSSLLEDATIQPMLLKKSSDIPPLSGWSKPKGVKQSAGLTRSQSMPPNQMMMSPFGLSQNGMSSFDQSSLFMNISPMMQCASSIPFTLPPRDFMLGHTLGSNQQPFPSFLPQVKSDPEVIDAAFALANITPLK